MAGIPGMGTVVGGSACRELGQRRAPPSSPPGGAADPAQGQRAPRRQRSPPRLHGRADRGAARRDDVALTTAQRSQVDGGTRSGRRQRVEGDASR